MERIIDGVGRILIPKEIRAQAHIKDNMATTVDVTVENGNIIIKPIIKSPLDERRTTIYRHNDSRVLERKREFRPGDRVKLINMESEAYLLSTGSTGTVIEVDDIGSIHVKWDDGRVIAVLDIDGDVVEKL